VAAQVAHVLTRAESLFATAGETATTSAALSRAGDAALTAGALSERTAELSGAMVEAHRDVAGASAQQLRHASGVDSMLADHLTRSTQLHTAGGSQASGIRAGAAEIPAQLQPWADLPASDMAGLKMLRNHLAAMQRLLAQHSAVSARIASDVSGLTYQVPDQGSSSS
jgi:hypothetical protein